MSKKNFFKLILPTLLVIAGVTGFWHARWKLLKTEIPDTHWAQMYQLVQNPQHQAKYSALALGDSRMAVNLSPDVLKKSIDLPGEVLNFSFTNVCYSKEYLNAAKGLLAKARAKSFVLISVGPYNLSTTSCQLSGFEKQRSAGHSLSSWFKISNFVTFYIRPLRVSHLRSLWSGQPENHFVYQPNGWLAARGMTADFAPLNFFSLQKNNQLSDELIENLVEFTRQQVSEGTQIFFVYPPMGLRHLEAEVSLKNYRSSKIRERLSRVGGVWLDTYSPKSSVFHPFDGAHLKEEDAILWTQQLGQQITSYWEQKTSSGSTAR